MENYAKRLAIEHKVQGKMQKKNNPINYLKADFRIIRKSYELLTQSISLDIPIPPSGEWILDNFYIIEEQVNSIEKELIYDSLKNLPAVKGKLRIFLIAEKLVSLTDGNVTKETIEKFLINYESKRRIEMKEIWLLPVMLKIALINYIKDVAERIITSQYQKFKVASLIERIIDNKNLNEQVFYQYRNINLNGEISSYIEFLVYLLKKEGKSAKKYLNILTEEIEKAGTTLDEIIKTEHYDMALRRVSAGNSITSIKNILRYNWSDIFEKINGIEKILNKDIWYKKSDYDTKILYRNEIQNFAQKTKMSETYIAMQALDLAEKGNTNIGEFILGDKKKYLFEKLDCYYKKPYSNNEKLFLYIIFIFLPSLIISLKLMKYYFWISIIPLSEIFLTIANRICAKTIKPKLLPRLEEIDDDVKTFVIVPTLLKSKEKVKDIFKNLEVFYLGNKIDNLYFALLGDASEEDSKEKPFDKEIIEMGENEASRLNLKYNEDKFFFLYRERLFNPSQNKWLGYERKRGLITEFVHFLSTKEKGSFIINTIKEIPNIKYIITLDADTILPMDMAKKLIGTMEHPLNKPEVKNKIVIKGYGLIQPKIGITMESSTSSIFAKLFAGDGGIDAYSTAESNVYQDVFEEGIFTGKGIFNVELFEKLLRDEIPENTVLSHDLLEGSYLRCGLASDILLIDGFPSKLNSYMNRLSRWTRGDWQISKWIFKDGLNQLSKYKIIDNLRRSLLSIFLLILFFTKYSWISILVIFSPFLIDIFERIAHDKIGTKMKNYLPIFNGLSGSFGRCLISICILPYKSFLMAKSIIVSLYRMIISKKNLLEWTTSAEAEKSLKNGLLDYIKAMTISIIAGAVLLIRLLFIKNINFIDIESGIISILWIISPYICYVISQPIVKKEDKLSKEENEDLKEIARRTWMFFQDTMVESNNFLPADNYQFGRKNKFVCTTSSTNIGLGLMAIISAYDMQFISKETCINKIKNVIDVIQKLEKWNGHLFNWYNIKKLEPLYPRFISTVDSGNFIGYLYVLKRFLIDNGENEYACIVENIINNTDFSKLYDKDKNIFSIGYDIRENKLVDSYYDLLASEARLGSFVAIAKKDVPYKHWFSMSRTLTSMDKHKGLVSWSGTMFEYFMPLVIMKSYPYTLLDETYDFCIYSQKKYAKKLNIPWGISESAFNLQDLNDNYQYKAFGIPWLGLKRRT